MDKLSRDKNIGEINGRRYRPKKHRPQNQIQRTSREGLQLCTRRSFLRATNTQRKWGTYEDVGRDYMNLSASSHFRTSSPLYSLASTPYMSGESGLISPSGKIGWLQQVLPGLYGLIPGPLVLRFRSRKVSPGLAVAEHP